MSNEVYSIFSFFSMTNEQIHGLQKKIEAELRTGTTGKSDLSTVLADVQPHGFWSTDPVEMSAVAKGKPAPRKASVFVKASSVPEGQDYLNTMYRALNRLPGYGCEIELVRELK